MREDSFINPYFIGDELLMEKLIFILSGKNRIKIYYSLLNSFKTPRQIEKEIGIALSTVSRTLKVMEEKRIVIALNITKYHGKLYKLLPDVLSLKKIISLKIEDTNK